MLEMVFLNVFNRKVSYISIVSLNPITATDARSLKAAQQIIHYLVVSHNPLYLYTHSRSIQLRASERVSAVPRPS